jgi:hypothetical protein
LTGNKPKLCKKIIITLVWEKNSTPKIAENWDHNNDPCLGGVWPKLGFVKSIPGVLLVELALFLLQLALGVGRGKLVLREKKYCKNPQIVVKKPNYG